MRKSQSAMLRSTTLGFAAASLLAGCYSRSDAQDFSYTNMDGAITITGYKGQGGVVTIPSSLDALPVTAIGNKVFWFLSNVTSVVIPEGVTRIGQSAFGNCSGLTNVTMPSSLLEIGDGAFWACTALFKAQIPARLVKLGRTAFEACANLQSITIPESVTDVGEALFIDCTGLTNVDIRNRVLGTAEFMNCTNLSNVAIPKNISEIPSAAFGATGLRDVTIPAGIGRIGEFAFSGCRNLTNIIIPEGVTNIGSCAFASCTALSSIVLPDTVTRIEDGRISKGVTGAFSACTSLTNVVLGKSLTYIGDGAFFTCSNLASIVIPNSVNYIGHVCFAYSPNLTAVYFEGDAPDISLTAFEVFSQADPTTVYYLPGTTGWGPSIAKRPTALWRRSSPVILATRSSLGIHTDGFGFRVSWATNASTIVEACTNLAVPIWQSLAPRRLNDGTADFRDAQWTNYPARFYRVRAE